MKHNIVKRFIRIVPVVLVIAIAITFFLSSVGIIKIRL